MNVALKHLGFGLVMMRERVRALGGHFDLCSKPGQGVRVSVEVPATDHGQSTNSIAEEKTTPVTKK